MDVDVEQLAVLRQEQAQVFGAIRATLATGDRVLAVGSAFIVGVLTIAVDKGATVVFLGVPLALALLVTYQLQVYADAKVLRLYQSDIEALINRALARELLNGATATRARGSAFNPSVRIVRWIYALVIAASAVWVLLLVASNSTNRASRGVIHSRWFST